MPKLGYALSSEEHGPLELVRNAARAEQAGFEFALISDHFHPWTDRQGQSPFVWSVIGGIAEATERLRLGTGVTCPTIRTHPAIIAHAAATSAVLMEGRFTLGLGTGENLNEHVVGEGWPAPDERLSMLEEAIEVIRLLWEGGYQTHRGEYFEVEQARLYSLPDEPPDIALAAAKPLAAELAGRVADAFINTSPDSEPIEQFESAGGKGKPKYGQITGCSAATSPTSFRSRSTSSRRRRTPSRRTSRRRSPAARTPTAGSRTSAPTSRPGTRTSTSTRSAATRRASCASGRRS